MRVYRLCPKSGERHEAQRDKEGLFVLGAPEHGPRKHLKENKSVCAPRTLSMTAMALDPAGGGRDSAELALDTAAGTPNYLSQGQETADGSTTAAMVVRYRLDAAPVIVDVGGGYGGGVTVRLKDNGIEPVLAPKDEALGS